MGKKCVLCNQDDSNDSKDGIPVHRFCWYRWLEVTHQGKEKKAIQSLHDLQQKMNRIRNVTMNQHKDFKF